jgi:hypothetical protein
MFRRGRGDAAEIKIEFADASIPPASHALRDLLGVGEEFQIEQAGCAV